MIISFQLFLTLTLLSLYNSAYVCSEDELIRELKEDIRYNNGIFVKKVTLHVSEEPKQHKLN